MRIANLIIALFFVIIGQVSFGQVYQLMPQYGYQAPRMSFDSTLQIPTTCGVPTLKSVQFATKKGAIAFDSCNNRFYQYNPKTQSWSQVSGGGVSTDTTSLSNRINLKIDSVKRRLDSVFAYRNGTEVYQYKDSVGDTSSVVIAKVHNATGTLLQRGEVVYLFGATGDVASVKRANNKQDSTSSKTFGIVRRDIPIGGTGYVTTQGQLEKLNLGSFNAGDILYLDSIDGQITNVLPIPPYHSVVLGITEKANAGNGIMYVKIANGFELGELHNVRLNGTLNNHVLVYSDTQQLWKNRNIYSIVDTTSLSSRINQKLSSSDTSSLSNRINQRLLISDTTSMLNPYLRKTDTTSLSNRINLKFNTSDTSSLQQKSLPANSLMANNTTSQANPTAIVFKQFGNQTYTDSITITGTLNPSGAINHTFRWSQVGNLVTLHITLTYATNGTLSQVAMELPDGLPIPILPTGLSSNNDIISYGTGFMVSSTTGVAGVFSKVFLRQNTGLTNDYEIVINQGANSSYRIMNATIQYFAQ